MEDEEIDELEIAMKNGKVWYVYDNTTISPCRRLIREWVERFNDGSLATTAEPAVKLDDGKFVALWSSDKSEFVRLIPI